jgi:hypothetical protein
VSDGVGRRQRQRHWCVEQRSKEAGVSGSKK